MAYVKLIDLLILLHVYRVCISVVHFSRPGLGPSLPWAVFNSIGGWVRPQGFYRMKKLLFELNLN